MKIVTSDQMRHIEAGSHLRGVTNYELMEEAGLAVARRVRHHHGYLEGTPITVLVGPGNNGGDGLVAARHLHIWGARVIVYLCSDRRKSDSELVTLLSRDVTILPTAHDTNLVQLKRALDSTQLMLDAILGTGQSRPIAGKLERILLEVSKAKVRNPDLSILSVDVPTGLNADTGAIDPVCLTADVTVTLGYPKIGLYSFPGADKTGVVEVADIGIPPGLDDAVALELMTPRWAKTRLPSRHSNAHKGSFGKTLVVAGSRNYIGAASLAATAAMRAGCGLVTIATPQSIQVPIAATTPEPTYLPLPELSPGLASPEGASVILNDLARYDALLVGCGLGLTDATSELVERILYSGEALPPTVVDADALNILSMSRPNRTSWWERFSSKAIITPHPGEMGRLAGKCTDAIQGDRVNWAIWSATKWNKVTVLKGAHTVVASPSGRAMLSPFANPALASAGTGDVLAGTIAGLLAQGLALEDAASLGVYLHGAAGERVRNELGNTGTIASDILQSLPRAIMCLRTRALRENREDNFGASSRE